MKHLLHGLIACAFLFAFVACESEAEPADDAAAPDYALFDKKVGVIKSFIKAHCDENLNLMGEMLSDTMRWSPPNYNGNTWLGKSDYLAALKGYHDGFENIRFQEGIVMPDTTVHGMWSGSVFPEETATSTPDNIRIYGTWTGTHSASGKQVGVKWFALGTLNADGKITGLNEYFDVGGLAAQVAEDAE